MKSRRMRLVGYVARVGEKRNAYRFLVGKSEGKRQLGRWADHIKINIREIGYGWIHLA
jgi:hypothetical protein